MIKKIRIFIFILSLAILGLLLMDTNVKLLPRLNIDNSYHPSEKIIYDVKLGKVPLGKAEFNNLPMVELKGRKMNLATFKTKLVRFTDREKIYSDPESNLPLRVERDIHIWPIREKIIEEYDQKNFTLSIKKFKRKGVNQVLIKREGPIYNAILLPFHLRGIEGLKVGWSFFARLPGKEFKIKLVSIEEVKIPAGTFNAYYFKSIPRKFEIWISKDERRIPLKIKGMRKLGYTLLMRKYSIQTPKQ